MEMACSDAFWNTVLKLTCLQQKASKPISAFTKTTCYNLRTRGNSTCSSDLYFASRTKLNSGAKKHTFDKNVVNYIMNSHCSPHTNTEHRGHRSVEVTSRYYTNDRRRFCLLNSTITKS